MYGTYVCTGMRMGRCDRKEWSIWFNINVVYILKRIDQNHILSIDIKYIESPANTIVYQRIRLVFRLDCFVRLFLSSFFVVVVDSLQQDFE